DGEEATQVLDRGGIAMKLGRLSILHRYVIGPADDPYMIRFAIVKSPSFGLCVHKFVRSDYERALHDHPWWYASFVLVGSYVEEFHVERPDGRPISVGEDGGLRARTRRTPWSFALRPAKWRHRVILDVERTAPYAPVPCWTLVLMGP